MRRYWTIAVSALILTACDPQEAPIPFDFSAPDAQTNDASDRAGDHVARSPAPRNPD